MAANYDKIAPVYDLLSRIIFGRQIINAQVGLLKYIPANGRLLIVGGGTGWILEEITKLHPADLTIDYVEPSARMMVLSRKRNCGRNTVNFIKLPIEDFNAYLQYDVIMTPFFFDNLEQDKIGIVFSKLNALLKANGLFLYTDFVNDGGKGPLWQKILLYIMYVFFKLTCGIEANELIDMGGYFNESYQVIIETRYYLKFIRAVAYQKT